MSSAVAKGTASPPSSGSRARRALFWFATAGLLLFALILRSAYGGWHGAGNFRGHQVAFFVLSSIQYEQRGLAPTLGYPSPAIDGVPLGTDDVVPLADDPTTLVYVNHPPTAALLAWAGMRCFGYEGWSEGKESVPLDSNGLWSHPSWDIAMFSSNDMERPFIALFLVGLLAFALCLREAYGSLTALLGAAVLIVTPVVIQNGSGVGYECPSLPFVFAALAFWVRHARSGSRRSLVLACISIAIGTAITWGPLFLVPAIALESAVRRRWTLVTRALQCLGLSALAPLVLHLILATATGAEHPGAASRSLDLLAPLATSPLGWLGVQADGILVRVGPWIVALGAAGLALVARLGVKVLRVPGETGEPPVCAPAVLLVAALLQTVAFARHAGDGQPIYQLILAPAVAGLAAIALGSLARRLRQPGALIAITLVCFTAADAIDRAEDQQFESHMSTSGYFTNRPERVPKFLGEEIGEHAPAGSIVVIPAWYGELTLPMSVYAWRDVVALEEPGDVQEIRKRFPAARGKPTFAAVFDSPEGSVLGEINRTFEDALPAESELVHTPDAFMFRIWRLP